MKGGRKLKKKQTNPKNPPENIDKLEVFFSKAQQNLLLSWYIMATHSLNHVKSLQKELTDLTNEKKASKLYQQQETFFLIGSIYLSKTKNIQ